MKEQIANEIYSVMMPIALLIIGFFLAGFIRSTNRLNKTVAELVTKVSTDEGICKQVHKNIEERLTDGKVTMERLDKKTQHHDRRITKVETQLGIA